MPKIVDVDERRRQIAEALWRVAARDGLAAASVRAVADECGMSAGALRHYFESQEELQVFAMASIEQSVRDHLQAVEATAPAEGSEIDWVVEALMLLVPSDDESRTASRIWFDFAALAQTSPFLRPVLRDSHDAIAGLCRSALSAVNPSAASDDAVARLHALIDGLALQGTYQPDLVTPERSAAIVRAEVERIADAKHE